MIDTPNFIRCADDACAKECRQSANAALAATHLVTVSQLTVRELLQPPHRSHRVVLLVIVPRLVPVDCIWFGLGRSCERSAAHRHVQVALVHASPANRPQIEHTGRHATTAQKQPHTTVA